MGHREKVEFDGVVAPSVTSVIGIIDKPFLKIWFGKLGLAKAQQTVKDSQILGQNVHEAIESYFRGETIPDLSQREAAMFSLFKGWAMQSHFSPIELETYLENRKDGYYGTCDAIGSFDGGPLLMADWKTSAQVDKTYGCQLAAYAAAYKETTGIEITEGFVVRVDKKEDAKKPIEIVRYENLPRYYEVFLHCLQVWKFVNNK